MSAPEDELLDRATRVVERARQMGADVAEATARQGSHLSAKVRMRKPELVEEAGSRSVGLRVMIDQQVAVTYTSDLSRRGLDRLVEDALELARLSEADSFAGPPDPSLLSDEREHAELKLYDSGMSDVDSGAALARATAGEAAALDASPRITNSDGATFTRAAGSSVLVTSGGFSGTSRGTYASLVVRPVAEDADGKKRAGSYWAARRHLDALEGAAAVGEGAARRTLRKLGATKLQSCDLPVVFDPDAGRAILGLVASCVGGGAIWRKSSYLAGRLDTRVASDLVTIVDDPLILRAPGSRAFDGEGLLSRKNVVIQGGMLETYLLDSYSARKLEMKSTASASRGASGGVGASTSNFILQRGDSSVDDLLGSTRRGLYVTEMMGFGFNAVTGDFSRGAAGFLIEDGELTRPINEVTISLPLDDLLQRIDAVADDLDQRTAIATPTFRVSSMTIAGR